VRTAIDSSVIILLLRRQPGWEQWRRVLDEAASESTLLVCSVVFAECSPGFKSYNDALSAFSSVHIHYDPLSPEAAHLAGQTYIRYRREGGPRRQLIPDFLIAAHAAVQADQLAAIDRGYLRRYFPKLNLVSPA
jgi:predicted nucleic acid-binding protein